MTVMLTCKDIRLDYPTKRIFEKVTLGVESGDRIGIVGRNGDGKSTLLRVLSRAIEPDAGQVIPNGSSTIGFLGQTDSFLDDDIVEDQLDAATPALWKADRKSRAVVEALLGDVEPTARVGTLSGGQRRRLDLARLLIGDWDILMLDEPTNHLDMEAISWLADHLKNRWQRNAGALLVVTHDRWFLDEACLSMWEVHDGMVDPFEGGYSAYIMQRVERDRMETMAQQKRENQLRKELAWLSRGAQARRSKPRFHIEAAQALIADEPPVRDPLELKRVAMSRLGKQVVELHDVCMTRGSQSVLKDVTWNIGPGDRIGLLGANGKGKSTLLAIINGSLKPTWGHVKIGKTVHFATLSQHLDELKDVEGDTVRLVCSRYKTQYEIDGKKLSPTALLERLGFSRDELQARVEDLSGGQRRRLQLLLTLLDEPNVLILDEPGNDLDTDMLAVMEDLLDSWPGTLIVVSHDRYFIERVTDDQFAIIDERLQHMPGGVDEYLRTVEQRRSCSGSSTASNAQAVDASKAAPASTNADTYKMRKQLASIERKMATQRARVEAATQNLGTTDPYDYEALAAAQAAIQQARNALDELEEAWLEVSEALEA